MKNWTWQSPTDFKKHDLGMFKGGINRRTGYLDYHAFTEESIGGLSSSVRGRAGAVARTLGGIGRASQPLSKTFNLMGRNITYGRAGLTAGLGLLAVRNGANMMDRMRYGDYGGAMMSGAMTAAAGYGAYSAYMYKGAFRSHFNNVAKKMIGWAAR